MLCWYCKEKSPQHHPWELKDQNPTILAPQEQKSLSALLYGWDACNCKPSCQACHLRSNFMQLVYFSKECFLKFFFLKQDLMNISYVRPHDPYIRIKESHWPPYIELLLRCGIAKRHPQDCNLIRLVAFNWKPTQRTYCVLEEGKKNSAKQKWEGDLQLVTGYGCFSAPACRDDCDSSKQQQQLESVLRK